jgi:hypothetical protein
MKDEEITKYYTNPENPGSLGGLAALKRELKKQNYPVTDSDLKRWSQSQIIYHRNLGVKKIFKRNKIYVHGIDDTWQIDLIDMIKHKDLNNGYAYILTCIDVFSKYGWAVPIKTKEAVSALDAMKKILNQKRKPKKIHSDKGTEFVNALVQKYLVENKIKFYTTESDTKACVVERFNRTLKNKIWRHFAAKKSETKNDYFIYIDVLQKLVNSYNSSYHRSIKMAPVNVSVNNESKVWKNIYGYNKRTGLEDKAKLKYCIGDYVRYKQDKDIFAKGYTSSFNYEIFIIKTILFSVPPRYKLIDFFEQDILGSFYDHQLTKVNLDSSYDFGSTKEVEEEITQIQTQNKLLIPCELCTKPFKQGLSMTTHLRSCRKKNPNLIKKI